jgi:hypothetical protein
MKKKYAISLLLLSAVVFAAPVIAKDKTQQTNKSEKAKQFDEKMKLFYDGKTAYNVLGFVSSIFQGQQLCPDTTPSHFIMESLVYGTGLAMDEKLDIETMGISDRGFEFLRSEIESFGSIEKYCLEYTLTGMLVRQ